MHKYNRIFLIVLDSLGIGKARDAIEFGDSGSDTLNNIIKICGDIEIPTLKKLGIDDFINKSVFKKDHRNSFTARLNEASIGKDTITGHWEMMGLLVNCNFKTFYDNGFPKELIDNLEKRTGYKFLGNYAASGTEIIKKLGEEHIRTKSPIIYTSSDSVLQIASHEEVISLDDLYNICKIAREICSGPKYLVGRVIARPFLGKNKDNFYRDSYNRRDFTLAPFKETVLDLLFKNNIYVLALGKVGDIFNNRGINEIIKIKNNDDGMKKIINIAKNNKEIGLYFLNLVDFDSEYGHRRDVLGYKKAIEEFDKQLKIFIDFLDENDLLIITSDHGNDPTQKGSDHTREQALFIAFSKKINNGKFLGEKDTFAVIGNTILFNFNLSKNIYMLGDYIKEIF